MKRVIFVISIVLLFAGCAGSLTVEVPENTHENQWHRLYRSFEEIVAAYTVEAPEDIRPHHYGTFDRVEYAQAFLLFYETTLDGLEPRAANIVRGRVGDDARIVLEGNSIFPGMLPMGRNFVSLEILEVIKGDLTVGETIRIMEPYVIHDGTFFTWNGYMPSIPHQEYIFFLQEPSANPIAEGEAIGAFWVAHGERSRFPVPDNAANIHAFSAATQDFNSDMFGLGSEANVEVYMQLWEEVMNEWVAAR